MTSEALEKFAGLWQLGRQKGAIIPTVMLLKSVGMARYINAHMETQDSGGFRRPDSEKPGPGAECVQIAAEIVAALKARVSRSEHFHHRLGGQTAVDPGGGRFIAASREF